MCPACSGRQRLRAPLLSPREHSPMPYFETKLREFFQSRLVVLHQRSRLRNVMLWCAVAAGLVGAFSSLGLLSSRIPGEQILYLSPSGRVVALPIAGGSGLEVGHLPAPQVTPAGWRPLGALQKVSDTLIAFPAQGPNGERAVILRGWRDDGPTAFDGRIDVGASARSFAWVGDTLVWLADGRRWSIHPQPGAAPQGSATSGLVGLSAWWIDGRALLVSWSSDRISVALPSGVDSTVVGSLTEPVHAAGVWSDGNQRGWGYLDRSGSLHWSTGALDTGFASGLQLLADTKPGAMLAWSPSSGELWRVSPGKRVALAHSLADILTSSGGEQPRRLLLGGSLAGRVSTLGDGIAHAGSFHQSRGLMVGVLRVDPPVYSPRKSDLRVTMGVLAPGQANWTQWLIGPSAQRVDLATGSSMPVGLLSTSWDGRIGSNIAPDGIWTLHASVERAGQMETDSLKFEVDGTAPTGVVQWDTARTVGPGRGLRVGLSGVIDNGDPARQVRLVALLRSGSDLRRIEVKKSDLPGGEWSFEGLAAGALLPEGNWSLSYAVLDSVGNSTDTTSLGSVRIRWGGPIVQAWVSPSAQPAGVAFTATLRVEIDGTPGSSVLLGGTGPDSSVMTDTVITLSVHGHAVVQRTVRSNALVSGVHSWILRATESGRRTDARAFVIVGELRPLLTNPSDQNQVEVPGRSIVVRGIAPDPAPTLAGTAVYRVTVHPGRVVVPSTTSWDALSTSTGTKLLPVLAARSVAPILSLDSRNLPGTVGSPSRSGQDEPLALLDPALLVDSVNTLVLWVGKGERVSTHSILLRRREADSISGASASLRLVRPSAAVLDRGDSDPGNDSLHWQVDGLQGEDVSVTVFGPTGTKVRSLPASTGGFALSGFDDLGLALRDGNYRFVVEVSGRGRMTRLDSSFQLKSARNRALPGLIQVEPSLVDLGLVRAGSVVEPTVRVRLTEPEITRVVVRQNDSLLGVWDSTGDILWERSWNGHDSSGRRWLDASSSPARGLGMRAPLSVWFVLQSRQGQGWQSLDSARLDLMDLRALTGRLTSLQVQGRGGDSLRVADLISDWKMRARLEGSLVYFPEREVNWDVLPYGRQTARQFLPVDYSVEWAKYYNSIAGFQNYAGAWKWQGYRYVFREWRGFVVRGRSDFDFPAVREVPFWMFAHGDMTGMGERAGIHVVAPDSFAGSPDSTRVGQAPVYDAARDTTSLELERLGQVFRLDPRKFFGNARNDFGGKAYEHDFFRTNQGYSGFHAGSPVDRFFNSSLTKFRHTTDLRNSGFCREVEGAKYAYPNNLKAFDSLRWKNPGFLTWYPNFYGVKLRERNVDHYDENLSKKIAIALAGSDTALLRCPRRKLFDTTYRPSISCRRFYSDSTLKTVLDTAWVDSTSFHNSDGVDVPFMFLGFQDYMEKNLRGNIGGDDEFWNSDSAAIESYVDIVSKSRPTHADTVRYDSLRNLIRTGLGTLDTTFTCIDGSLDAVLFNLQEAGINPASRDSVTLKEYIENLAPSSWATVQNLSADVRLDRPWVGVMDDAHFDPLPTSWNQYFYTYGPGYTKAHDDSLGRLIFSSHASNGITWEKSGSKAHNRMRLDHHKDSVYGGDRVVAVNPGSGHAYDRVLPGTGDRWWWNYTDDWGTTNYKYKYVDIFEDRDPFNFGGIWNPNYGSVENIGLRNQYAYTVPLRLNWSNPWFYLHDSAVTHVRRTLYADSVAPKIQDGVSWGVTSGGRPIDGLETYGGYKAGQIGYWFRPSNVKSDDTGALILPRSWKSNKVGQILREPQFLENYAQHVGPDDGTPFAHHDLAFRPRLKVNDTTWGVVWDTVSVPWPDPDLDASRPDHLDLATLQDKSRGGEASRGRTWARLKTVLRPDSLWIPSLGSLGTGQALDSVSLSLWDSLGQLPDQSRTADSSRRVHRAYSFVDGRSLLWTVAPLDAFGNRIDKQDRIRWSLDDTASREVRWTDGWTGTEQTYLRRDPIVRASYLPVGDTLRDWSSAQDSLLSGQGGWVLLSGRMDEDSNQFRPRMSVDVVPASGTDSSAPCYRPWVSTAFVRSHKPGQAACGDSVTLNPNLLIQPDGARWTMELFYPDGQTPNLDVQSEASSLQNALLRLSSDRSSQRWVKLQGRIPSTWVSDSVELPLLEWRAWGVQGNSWSALDVPTGFASDEDPRRAVRGGVVLDAWDRDSAAAATAWWNVTGRWGEAQFRIRALYGDSSDPRALWTSVPFVIGTPRDSVVQLLGDAYNRARLQVPATVDRSAGPIVLHTLAGDDLAALPLNGASPVGPVIQLAPSGTVFPDSTPAVLTYRLTLRELLREQGAAQPDSVLTVDRAVAIPALDRARDELVLWLLTDRGTLTRAQTLFRSEGDSTSLDGSFVVLEGRVTHFSYALLMNKDPKRALAPLWRFARWSGDSLRIGFNHASLKELGSSPASVVLRISGSSDRPALTDSLVLGQSSYWTDTTLSALPASWVQILSTGMATITARYQDGTGLRRREVDFPSRWPDLSAVRVAPHFVAGRCGESVTVAFGSDLGGTAVLRLDGPNGASEELVRVEPGSNAMPISVCGPERNLIKGVYSVLVLAVDLEGKRHVDSLRHMAWFGVDTVLHLLDTLEVPQLVALPVDTNHLVLRAAASGWDSSTTWIGSWRRVADSLGLPVSDAPVALDVVPMSGGVRLVPRSFLQEGTWEVRLSGRMGDYLVSRSAMMRVVRDSMEITLNAPVSTRLGEQALLELSGAHLKRWVLVHTSPSGERDTALASNISQERLRRSWSWATSNQDLGVHSFCLQGTGERGSVRSECRDVLVRPDLPEWNAARIDPQDTLWLGWSDLALRRVVGRRDSLVLQGSLDRAARLVRVLRDASGRVRSDTLISDAGRIRWVWDGRISAARVASSGPMVVEWGVVGSDEWLRDTLLVVKPSRAFVWARPSSSALADSVTAELNRRGVDAAHGDAAQAVDFLSSAQRGGLILLDSVLDARLWRGGFSGPLFDWVKRGGDISFVGSHALRSWTQGDSVLDGRAEIEARVGMYGIQEPSVPLLASLRRGLQRTVALDSVDAAIQGWWAPPSLGSSLTSTARLRWFDSAGVAVEAGWVGRSVDSLRYLNRHGKDTTAADTVLYGALRYFPPRESGPRRGALVEAPPPRVEDAASFAGYLWAQLFVPDLAVSSSDATLVPHTRLGRSGTWKPIRGDTLELVAAVRLRDGGMDVPLDSARVSIRDQYGLFDTVLTIRNLSVGRVELPAIRRILPDTIPFEPLVLELVADTLLWTEPDGIRREPYLRNNRTQTQILVGDTAKPRLWWKDSVVGGVRVRPVPSGLMQEIHAAGTTIHKRPEWKWSWIERAATLRISSDSSAGSLQGDTVAFTWAKTWASDLLDGDRRTVLLRAYDRFGNMDSLSMDVVADGIGPTILELKVDGITPVYDSSLEMYSVHIDTGSSDSATLTFKVQDNRLLGRISRLPAGASDSVLMLDTLGGRVFTATVRVAIQSDTILLGESFGDVREAFHISDAAGMDTSFRIVITRDRTAPVPWLTRVHVASGDGSVTRPTRFDRTVPTLWNKLAQRIVAGNEGFIRDSVDLEDPAYTWAPKADGVPVLVQVRQGDTLDFLTVVSDASPIDTMWVRYDGQILAKSRYTDVDPIIQGHNSQRLIQVVPNRSEHILVVGAIDAAGNQDSTVFVLQDSLADLQVIDSASDHGAGADWGEVYMRRDDVVPPGMDDAETWDYWLIHRRNPLGVGESDVSTYRLLLDLDTNSATGDRSYPEGFQGADLAVEWGPQTRADDGTAVVFRKLAWNPTANRWDTVAVLDREGLYALEGIALDIAQADDPATVEVGEGDQRLPTGTVARATGGAMEIGLRNANSGSLAPFRWAIVPASGAASDTVRDSTGGFLTFRPRGFKAVTVDAHSPDWWPDRTRPRVESYSVVAADPSRLRLYARNIGTVPVKVGALSFWLRSVTLPQLSLDSVPAGVRASLSAVRRETLRGLDMWSVTVLFDSLVLVGGEHPFPLGQLVTTSSDISAWQDDWSYRADSLHANEKLPLYAWDGHILWGSEPPHRIVQEPVAIIRPSQQLWVRTGERLALDGSGSFDPEGYPLSAIWRIGGLGRTDTGWTDTVSWSEPGLYEVGLEVRDSVHPERKAWAILEVHVMTDVNDPDGPVVRESTLVVFDEVWRQDWLGGSEYDLIVSDSAELQSGSGLPEIRRPAYGSKMLKLDFSPDRPLYLRRRCTATGRWTPEQEAACWNSFDLSLFTNLEFWVASDAGVRRPIRIWLASREVNDPGNGTGGIWPEQDFAYVQTYLPPSGSPDQWQRVSIPLGELGLGQLRPSTLEIKIAVDDPTISRGGAYPRVLIDRLEFVRYAAAQRIVTTRKSGLQVLANTQDESGTSNQLGMAVRLLNSGSIPLPLDSIRLRMHYLSIEGVPRGDTLLGPETPIYAFSSGMPLDDRIDRPSWSQVQPAVHDWTVQTSNSSHYLEANWGTPGQSGLSLPPAAPATFWAHLGRYNDAVPGVWSGGVVWPRYAGTRSLNWSWPDSSSIWQFAPKIVVDGLKSDGTWGRIWGMAPGEDPASVVFWRRERLVDPFDAEDASNRLRAKIRWIDSTTVPGEEIVLSADSSIDPSGGQLGYHWLDRQGHILSENVEYRQVLPDTGTVMIWLRVWNTSRPERVSTDSVALRVGVPGLPIIAEPFLQGPNGVWRLADAWGSNPTELPTWTDSVQSAVDSCSLVWNPAEGDKILRIPFGSRSLGGVRFEAPRSALDTGRFTHLEFWVASEKEWLNAPDVERSIRIWLTKQITPTDSFDNNTSEEDFTMLQTYLPEGRLRRRWQKVSIPLDELIQAAPARDTLSWQLKFMKDWTFHPEHTEMDADLILSGMQWARYDTGVRVTTRRTGAHISGSWSTGNSFNQHRGLVRLLNTSARTLRSDSIRIRIPVDLQALQATSASGMVHNPGYQGVDESVDQAWFVAAFNDSAWSESRQDRGLEITGDRLIRWPQSVPLAPVKGFMAQLQVSYVPGDTATPWFFPVRPDLAPGNYGYGIVSRMLVEQRKPDGTWGRLWGLLPGESFATTSFWSPEPLQSPVDTTAPANAFRQGACQDTNSSPPDTGVTVPPGDTAQYPTTGRDLTVTTRVVEVAGKPGVEINQGRPDWNVKHSFVFDSAWVRRDEINVEVYIDPSQMSASAWPGTLSLASFDGWSWIPLNPTQGVDMTPAVGAWRTLVFQYPPSLYTIGKSFELYLLANGRNGTDNRLRWVLGSIWLGDPIDGTGGNGGDPDTDSSADSSGGSPGSPIANGISMDSTTGWSVCNQCEARAEAGRTYLAVQPAGGAPALETTVYVDSAFRASKFLELDIFSEYPIQGWEEIFLVLVNPTSGVSWQDNRIKIPTDAGWTRVRIPFDGQVHHLGTTATLKIVLNSNAPAGLRLRLDNLTWVP